MERYRAKSFEIKEGRKVLITAACQDCSWSNSLPTTTVRLATDSLLLQEIAHQHSIDFRHKVEYKVGQTYDWEQIREQQR